MSSEARNDDPTSSIPPGAWRYRLSWARDGGVWVDFLDEHGAMFHCAKHPPESIARLDVADDAPATPKGGADDR